MNFGIMNKTWTESLTNTKILLFSNAVLVVVVLMMLAHQHGIRERIVLVPPHLTGKAEVDWDKADVGYYKEWATYLASMMGSINPRNVDFVTGAVDRLMDRSIAAKVKDGLLEAANDPEKRTTNVANWFEAVQTIYDPQSDKIFVIGSLNTAVPGQQPLTKPTVYEFSFDVRGGVPVAVYFDSYYDRYPHTAKWKEQALKTAAIRGEQPQQGQVAPASQTGK